MKKTALLFLFIASLGFGQTFTNTFTSNPIPGATASGWLYFEKDGDNWKSRMYYLDTIQFKITGGTFSNAITYSHMFTPEEQLAGYYIYSLMTDLNGDNYTDFYILSYTGNSSAYRQGFKIFSMVDGSTIFERKDNNTWYSEPTISDLDNDGVLDCSFYSYTFPYNGTYKYEVYSTGVTTDMKETSPRGFVLNQNFPNPFNPSTVIRFTLQKSQQVSVEIYNVEGRLIRTLVQENLPEGSHEISWDGKDERGFNLPSGIYFYSLRGSGHQLTKKMVLLK